MATYKVIQDIEAEDKLFGPLTLKQFIFAILAFGLSFIAFRMAVIKIYYALPLLPFIFILGILAAPLGRDQPTEVWILGKLRFWFKPRKRIWDQSGMQELVKITVPKKIEENLTDNLSPVEVQSRLKALATTIDSRGWVVKNVDINMYTQPSYGALATQESSDRLVSAESLPQQQPQVDIQASDDIFDNPNASQLDAQIEQSKQQHQVKAVEHMKQVLQNPSDPGPSPKRPQGQWYMPSAAPTMGNQTILPPAFAKPAAMDAKETALLNKLHKEKSAADKTFRNHKNVLPLSEQPPKTQPVSPGVTAPPPPDILNLAIGNDRHVDSLAREAQKNHPSQTVTDDGEVVISLH